MDCAGDTEVADGERAVRKAISINPLYAKYHATLARLLVAQKRFTEAKDEITRAIELEPSTGSHYALRVGDYQDTRTSITFAERSEVLRQEQHDVLASFEHVRGQFEGLRLQVVELMGLLAAVIAFLVAGVQIATKMTLAPASALMGVVTGSLITSFAAFSLLFLPDRRIRRGVALLVLGLVIIAGVWSANRWA
jgi:tetratricopeptide (TPR) repeat protein